MIVLKTKKNMEEITNKRLVFNADEIKEIIKEHLKSKGVDVQIIEFFGTTLNEGSRWIKLPLNYVNRDDYMGEPKFNLKTVVCQSYNKE